MHVVVGARAYWGWSWQIWSNISDIHKYNLIWHIKKVVG